MRRRRVLLSLLAPVSALVVALVITSIALLAIKKNPFTVFHLMASYGIQTNSMISIVNRAVPLYISALAVAIGFKMNLFNIGVEGQYLLAALVAAEVGALVHLPPPIHITLILLVAIAVGASWAGVAGVLKVTRGVSEVISTIMLNFIAFGLSAYLLSNYFRKPVSSSDLTTRTRDIPLSGQFPALDRLFGLKNLSEPLSGFIVVAIIVGILYYLLVWKTRFGYNLRATGVNPGAARVSGVDYGSMVIRTMLLSGGIAGLVGMMYLLSFFKSYSLDFPTGLGFTGIAVALVGRNHPVGIGIAALLFGFLERSAQILDLNSIPKEIFLIMEGIIILAVVIAYEVVRRLIEAQEVRAAADRAQRTVGAPQQVPAWSVLDRPRTEGIAGAPGGRSGWLGGDRRRRAVLLGVGLILVLAVVRVVTGADDLTSPGTFGAVLTLGIPIMLAGLGGLYAERSGVVNIGLEGMMILGTWFGAWAGWKYGVWWGVIAGSLGGGAGGLLHAVATVTFGIDQVVSGVAINILAVGVARFLSVVAYPLGSGGSATQSPQVTGNLPNVSLPILSGGKIFGWQSPDLFGSLAKRGWFLVSDLAGLLKGVTSNVAVLTLIALALVPLTYWFLWKTTLGLRLRSVGEHPLAAESLGVPVYTMKYLGVVISGCLAGLGGAFLVLEAAGIYREGQTGGRGFIGLAALIFGNWRPGGVAAAAALFGYADALQLRSDAAIHGLLLFVGIVFVAVALRMVLRRRISWGLLVGVIAGAAFFWYATSDKIPNQFVYMTPYVVTLVVLAVASQRLRPPAAEGKPYRRGQAQ